jgi:two-component system chemotaxis response regulator CheY
MLALIVDDSPTARAQARIALDDAASALGLALDVEEANGGVEALRILATCEVDVLLVDLHMPDVHGLDVLSFWRHRSPAGARLAVVVSTQVSDRDRGKALEHGAVSFVDKPVSVAAITTALTRLSTSAVQS